MRLLVQEWWWRKDRSIALTFLVLERSRMRCSFYKRKISCLPLHYAVFNKKEAMKIISRPEYLVHERPENFDGGSLVQANKFLIILWILPGLQNANILPVSEAEGDNPVDYNRLLLIPTPKVNGKVIMLLPQMELFKDSDIINVVLFLFFS